jgi:hypothetical protein
MFRRLLFLLCAFVFALGSQAQYANKKVRSKYQAYTDSLRQVEYDYVFPIWGQEAYRAGFDIPYPAGIMANYVWVDQGILIENLQLGYTGESVDIPLTEVDFIEFGDNNNTSWSANVRPDLWIFPFLNVYGIFGYGRSQTDVELVYPLSFKTSVVQDFRTAGFGLLSAFGIGPMWMSVDANFTWNKPELLDEAVFGTVLGVRLGHTFTSQVKPESNFALWVGGQRFSLQAATKGQIRMGDALPQDFWDRKDEFVDNYYDWYDNLGPAEIGKKLIADSLLTPIVEGIDAREGDATVKYYMDKQFKQMWNMTIGGQYQFNKRWMLRGEAGIIGDRKSFLLSLNYRFLI